MKAYISLIIIAAVFFSCKEDITLRNQKLILGEWHPIADTGVTSLGIRDRNMTGYQFMEDGFCDYYPGYFEYVDPDNGDLVSYPFRNLTTKRKLRWFRNIIRLYGNRTIYEINEDTVNIFNLSSKIWDRQIIHFLSPDTLVLSSLDSIIQEKYIRKKYTLDDQPLFDQLIFYNSDMVLEPAYFCSIHRDGTFVCSYHYSGGGNEIFTGKLKAGTFERLEDLFRKANLPQVIAETDSLNQKNIDYRSSSLSTLSPTFGPYVTFVSDNQFFTIEKLFDDAQFDNKALFWGYIYGFLLPQTAQFEPGTLHEQEKQIPFFENFMNWILVKQDSIVDLYHTEKFYLSVLLNQAERTNTDFEPVYTLKESFSSKKTMQTDGRYFSYIKDGEKIILDIGFNYIQKNKLDRMFRKKNSIEISFETGEKLVPLR